MGITQDALPVPREGAHRILDGDHEGEARGSGGRRAGHLRIAYHAAAAGQVYPSQLHSTLIMRVGGSVPVVHLPERAKDWLYTTPSSDSDVELRYPVLNAQLMLEMSRLQSVPDETRLVNRFAGYIRSIKPKRVTSEPAFLLCVEKWQRMLLGEYSIGISPTVANENQEVYLAWLRKVHSEAKSGASFSSMLTKFGRMSTYPVKIQPEFQSCVQAFRDLQQTMQYQEVGVSVFPVAGPFFTPHESHFLPQTTQLFSRCA